MISPEQRERRRLGIGGSDAAAIVLGSDGFRTRLDVYAEKVLDLPDKTDATREAGNILEPAIRALAAAHLGVEIAPDPTTRVHPNRPWMLVHLDGLAADGGAFEAKALDWRKAKQLGEQGTDECLRPHFFQVQHAMEVADLPWTHVAYLVGPYDLRLYVVERDRELGGILAEWEWLFWRDNVQARVPPVEEDPAAMLRWQMRARKTGDEALVVEPGTSAYEAMRELAGAMKLRKDAQRIEAAAKARVMAMMGDARKVTCDIGKVSWSRGKRVAWAAVAKALHPPKALIAEHTSTSERFLPSFEDDDSGAENPTEE